MRWTEVEQPVGLEPTGTVLEETVRTVRTRAEAR